MYRLPGLHHKQTNHSKSSFLFNPTQISAIPIWVLKIPGYEVILSFAIILSLAVPPPPHITHTVLSNPNICYPKLIPRILRCEVILSFAIPSHQPCCPQPSHTHMALTIIISGQSNPNICYPNSSPSILRYEIILSHTVYTDKFSPIFQLAFIDRFRPWSSCDTTVK